MLVSWFCSVCSLCLTVVGGRIMGSGGYSFIPGIDFWVCAEGTLFVVLSLQSADVIPLRNTQGSSYSYCNVSIYRNTLQNVDWRLYV